MSSFAICRYMVFALVCLSSTEVWARTAQLNFPKPPPPYRFVIGQKELGNGVGVALGAVRNYDVDEGNCSLVVTSNSCYALTAAHCIYGLLAAQGKVEWQPVSGFKTPMAMGKMKAGALPAEIAIGSSAKITWLRSGQTSRIVSEGVAKDLPSSRAKLLIDRFNVMKPEGEPAATGVEISIESKRVKVIAIGRGFGNRPLFANDFEPPANHDADGVSDVTSDSNSFYKFMRKSRNLDLADHALLKLPEENCSCVETGELSDSEHVIVAGFSGDAVEILSQQEPFTSIEYGRSGVPYSYGDQCFSFGSQAEILTKNLGLLRKVILYTTFGWELQQADEMYRNRMKHLKDKIIVTNARAAPGASGGAMLNSSNGQLVGITSTILLHASGQKALGVRVSEIKDQYKTSLAESTLNEAFNCTRQR